MRFSGHAPDIPGQPMGCAELGALLYGEILSHYPQDPSWVNRDRFVQSSGHGCLLQYALLHLCGYDISVEDMASFRRLDSKATGHPEHGIVPGVEVTTGPLGQGMGNAVGMAIAERMLAARFNTARTIIDYYTYWLVGDGDLMEGVSYEASSLAGHLGLGKLILFYDSNGVTIEGSTKLCFTEDIRRRFRACNWQVFEGSAYDIPRIMRFVTGGETRSKKAHADHHEVGDSERLSTPGRFARGARRTAGRRGSQGKQEGHGGAGGFRVLRARRRPSRISPERSLVGREVQAVAGDIPVVDAGKS